MSKESFEVIRKKIQCILPVYPFQHDDRLTLQAKGLLALLLSFPDSWTIYMRDVISRSKNGRDATRKALRELVEAGYVQKIRLRTNNKFCGLKYRVLDEPEQISEDGFSGVREIRRLGNQATGNPGDINNNNLKLNNLKDINKKRTQACEAVDNYSCTKCGGKGWYVTEVPLGNGYETKSKATQCGCMRRGVQYGKKDI